MKINIEIESLKKMQKTKDRMHKMSVKNFESIFIGKFNQELFIFLKNIHLFNII
jgi:hypothetical protein